MSDHLVYSHLRRICNCIQLYPTDQRLVFQTAYTGAAGRKKSDFHILSGRVFFYLKLALVCGVLLACPVIFMQIWRFTAPGLYQHEKKILLPFVIVSSCCFLGGAFFGYFIVFPPAFRFLIGYTSDFLEALPAVSEYFSLSIRLLFCFGAIFEMPVLMVFLAKIGVINVDFLKRNRKYAILINFILAAILTPTPDIVNQLLMAVPLLFLYEVSIFAVAFFAKKTFSDFENNQQKL